MPPSNHISIGTENFTAVGLEKFNLTDQEFHIQNVSKAVGFQQENQTTTGRQHNKIKGCIQFNCYLISSRRFLVSYL